MTTDQDGFVLPACPARAGGTPARLWAFVGGSVVVGGAGLGWVAWSWTHRALVGGAVAVAWLAWFGVTLAVRLRQRRRGYLALRDGVVSCREYREVVQVPAAELRTAVRVPVAYPGWWGAMPQGWITLLLDGGGRVRMRLGEGRWGEAGVAELVARLGLPRPVVPERLTAQEIDARFPGSLPSRGRRGMWLTAVVVGVAVFVAFHGG